MKNHTVHVIPLLIMVSVTVTVGLTVTAVSLISCSSAPSQSASLVLRGGKIATVDPSFSFVEAVAVSGDTIVAAGIDSDIEQYVGPNTKVIELKGRLVVPGLIDAHAHMLGYGTSLAELDLRGTMSFRQIVEMVAEKAETTSLGEWILGSSWDQNDWKAKEFPNHDILSKAVPDNPVWLIRVDGHAAIANDNAMKIAGISIRSKDPDGGEILRGPDGHPTGVFIDLATGMVSKHIPDPSPEQLKDALFVAAQRCCEAGLTGVHDAGVSPSTVGLYKHLIDHDRLSIRINAMIRPPGPDIWQII